MRPEEAAKLARMARNHAKFASTASTRAVLLEIAAKYEAAAARAPDKKR